MMLTGTISRRTAVGLRLSLVSVRQLSCHTATPARATRPWSKATSSHLLTSIQAAQLGRLASTSTTSTSPHINNEASSSDSIVATYSAPLGSTFRRLKLFSLSSLTIASLATPALLLAPGDYTLFARLTMAITALFTSGLSTSLIAFLGGPYVTTMRLVQLPVDTNAEEEEGQEELKHVIEMDTYSWRLQKITTTIYEPSLLRPTERPFATWEVALAGAQIKALLEQSPNAPLAQAQVQQRIIAQSRYAKSGEERGRFVLSVEKDQSEGDEVAKVEAVGYPLRHFQVHEELLGEEWQVLD